MGCISMSDFRRWRSGVAQQRAAPATLLVDTSSLTSAVWPPPPSSALTRTLQYKLSRSQTSSRRLIQTLKQSFMCLGQHEDIPYR